MVNLLCVLVILVCMLLVVDRINGLWQQVRERCFLMVSRQQDWEIALHIVVERVL
jgi:hypothetical protein